MSSTSDNTPSSSSSFSSPVTTRKEDCVDDESYRNPLYPQLKCQDHIVGSSNEISSNKNSGSTSNNCYNWYHVGLDHSQIIDLVINCPVSCHACGIDVNEIDLETILSSSHHSDDTNHHQHPSVSDTWNIINDSIEFYLYSNNGRSILDSNNDNDTTTTTTIDKQKEEEEERVVDVLTKTLLDYLNNVLVQSPYGDFIMISSIVLNTSPIMEKEDYFKQYHNGRRYLRHLYNTRQNGNHEEFEFLMNDKPSLPTTAIATTITTHVPNLRSLSSTQNNENDNNNNDIFIWKVTGSISAVSHASLQSSEWTNLLHSTMMTTTTTTTTTTSQTSSSFSSIFYSELELYHVHANVSMTYEDAVKGVQRGFDGINYDNGNGNSLETSSIADGGSGRSIPLSSLAVLSGVITIAIIMIIGTLVWCRKRYCNEEGQSCHFGILQRGTSSKLGRLRGFQSWFKQESSSQVQHHCRIPSGYTHTTMTRGISTSTGIESGGGGGGGGGRGQQQQQVHESHISTNHTRQQSQEDVYIQESLQNLEDVELSKSDREFLTEFRQELLEQQQKKKQQQQQQHLSSSQHSSSCRVRKHVANNIPSDTMEQQTIESKSINVIGQSPFVERQNGRDGTTRTIQEKTNGTTMMTTTTTTELLQPSPQDDAIPPMIVIDNIEEDCENGHDEEMIGQELNVINDLNERDVLNGMRVKHVGASKAFAAAIASDTDPDPMSAYKLLCPIEDNTTPRSLLSSHRSIGDSIGAAFISTPKHWDDSSARANTTYNNNDNSVQQIPRDDFAAVFEKSMSIHKKSTSKKSFRYGFGIFSRSKDATTTISCDSVDDIHSFENKSLESNYQYEDELTPRSSVASTVLRQRDRMEQEEARHEETMYGQDEANRDNNETFRNDDFALELESRTKSEQYYIPNKIFMEDESDNRHVHSTTTTDSFQCNRGCKASCHSLSLSYSPKDKKEEYDSSDEERDTSFHLLAGGLPTDDESIVNEM